jgi:hypothetical protein
VLANTGSRSVSPKISLSPKFNGDGLSSIVPSALRSGSVDNRGCGRRDRSVAVSLEGPAHIGIVGFRREVFTCIAVRAIGPVLTLVNDTLTRGNEDSN